MEDKITVVGKSAAELSAHYTMINKKYELGMPELAGTETFPELKKMVGVAQEAMVAKVKAAEATNNGDTKKGKKGGATVGEVVSGEVYVFLKSPAYVDLKGTKRVAGGFYHVKLRDFPRLEKTSADVCVIFGEEMPVRKLAAVAEWFGVSLEDKTDEEVLEHLLKEPKLY